MNRYLMWVIISLMALVIFMGFFLLPGNNLLRNYEQHKSTAVIYNVPMNPVVSAEINSLKGQLVGLISGSIESKLRSLEASIRSGKASEIDLGTIQDLKNEVKVLKTYSDTGAGRLIAQPYAIDAAKSKSMTDDKLLKEVSHLRNLIYLCVTSISLMFAAVGGIWLQSRYRLGYLDGGNKRGKLSSNDE